MDLVSPRGLSNPPISDGRARPSKWICFLNAMLQAIHAAAASAAEQVADCLRSSAVVTLDVSLSEGARAFAEIMRVMSTSGRPADALPLLRSVHPACQLGQYQDAAEYVVKVFDQVDEFWENPFRIEIQTCVQCSFCGHVQPDPRRQVYTLLPMPMSDAGTKLQRIIDTFFQAEGLVDRVKARWRCPVRCEPSQHQAAQDAALNAPEREWAQTCLHELERGASYRLVQLKRFTNAMLKDTSPVHVQACHTFRSMHPITKVVSKSTWNVIGLVIHHGAVLRQGHFVTYAKRGDAWWEFDDDRVTAMTWREVQKASADVYIVVFARVISLSLSLSLSLGCSLCLSLPQSLSLSGKSPSLTCSICLYAERSFSTYTISVHHPPSCTNVCIPCSEVSVPQL